ncbi:Rhodanese-like domain-containing protein [Neurospora tetraspora]|uniref:Rhodanese-like domain-containing protein n=1 Tax=Neurospora tetraspora TaxID=94610 RepID=A0AAE0JMM4_9PEZI|nr:Rhodanese-like domain-containing protein [Neurospora tetraspora]
MSTAPETETKPAPWYAAFPEPQSDLMNISRAEVLEMLKGSTGEVVGKDFVLVDLRRNDFEGGTIRGSINLPAQSLYPTLPTVYAMFKAAGLKKVIFYCGSSTGRGSRGARWLSDYLLKVGDESIQSLALFEGIKGWANAGPEYVEWMEGYDASVWERLKSQ